MSAADAGETSGVITTFRPRHNSPETISTTRPSFRVGYRKRSTTTSTTPQPTITSSNISTSRSRLSSSPTNITTPSPRTTKLSRRKTGPRTTSKPVESQVSTTFAPVATVTSRYRFVSRKPYLKTTTQKRTSQGSTDQTIESTNHQLLEDLIKDNTAATELADIALALQKVQQAPVPQAKPSRKRPQILKLSSQYTTRVVTAKPNATTVNTREESYSSSYGSTAQKNLNKKTVAMTVPYFRGNYVSPQPITADRFVTGTVVTAAPFRELYSSPHSITAKDFINIYSSSAPSSTRARIRYSTTNSPLLVITPGKITDSKRKRKPTQAFEKILTPANVNTYKPHADYDYYDNIEASIFGKIPEHSKVLLHSNGIIECLDQGNFPHPVSCKKFISCAKMENNRIIGWEYTCPKNLSFDPIGGMCNWSAGLGCNEA